VVLKPDTSENRSEILESSEIWCWSRMEKIFRTDHVKNEEGGNFEDSNRREYPTYNRTMEGKV
jgi:hypothetical protein